MSDLNVEEFRAALRGRDAIERHIAEIVESTSSDPDTVLDEIAAELSEADRRALARPDVRAVFRDTIGESLRGSPHGWIDDDLAFARPWGFRLDEVVQEAFLLQGELDFLVPRAHMDYLASKLPRARLEIVGGAGHTLFDEMEDVVRRVVSS